FGALVGELVRRGVLAHTIVVVTADHGEEFQEHGRLTHGSHLYEESVRVPLGIVGPGIASAARDDTPQGIDLMPTVAHVLGAGPPAGLPGFALLSGPAPERPALIETSSGIGDDLKPTELVAIRTSRWKLIETPAVGRRELYDLETDPHEGTDRFAAAPDTGAS